MNRILLALTLCAVAAPGHSMTATVPPGNSSGSPAAPVSSNAATDATKAATTAATGKPAPASFTRPANVLSAPGVPMKASAATGARSGVAPSKSTVFMPGANSQSGAMAPAPNSAGWTRAASQGTEMRRGTLQAINVNPGTFQVFGQKLNFNPQQVKVFNRDGRPGSVYALKSGAKVRFTLDPKDPAQRRVAAIYVD